MNLYRFAYELVLMMKIMCVFQLEEILEGNRYVKGGNRYWKNIVDLPLFVSLRSSIFHSCACPVVFV